MAEYMGSHNTSVGGHNNKDLSAMMLPHTSMGEPVGDLLSPSSEAPDGLPSPGGYMGRVNSAGSDFVGPGGYISHSALTGLAAAAQHHARFASMGPSMGSNPNLMQGMGSPGHHSQGMSSTTPQQLSPGTSMGGGGGGGGGGHRGDSGDGSGGSGLGGIGNSGGMGGIGGMGSGSGGLSGRGDLGGIGSSGLSGRGDLGGIGSSGLSGRGDLGGISSGGGLGGLGSGLSGMGSSGGLGGIGGLSGMGGGGGGGGLNMGVMPVETSDMGSGGATLSISYMRQGDNYVCSLCGKTVASKAAITRHIQLTHEKKKPFECNICHRRFGYKNILLEHQNIHFGIKPYSCNLCDKRFAARSNLFQHRLLHMKPFHCEVCNKRFDRADQLQRHLKLHPTSNLLSCNLCNFQATNVEALNVHLRESHTLQTYNTRSRFGQGDDYKGGIDMPSQVPLSLAGTAAALALNLENEAMRKIDTICSQLASKSQPSIKSEPVSPGFASSSHGGFPPMSPSADLSSPPFSSAGDQSPYAHGGGGGGAMSMAQMGGSSSHHHRGSGSDDPPFMSPQHDNNNGGGGGGSYTGDSPTSSVSVPGFPLRQAAGQFLTPNRRAASVGSIPGIQAFSRLHRNNNNNNNISNNINNNPPSSPLPPHHHHSSSSIRSSADSTTNLSEFFSILQGLIQRSQDIPELLVSISRPKNRQDVGTQHNAINLSAGDNVPNLHDILVYYESQGKIYRCSHCKILFEERGMYFLHKSLHGELSPWECSICHKICADKNDFHLHFVNEQHQSLESLS